MRKYNALIFVMALIALHFDAYGARKTVSKDVMNTDTKIVSATTNTLVDEECQNSYFGCMDTFCMVENIAGGRCQCSNKHANLSLQLNDLMARDEKAENIAQYGADFVNMGDSGDTVINAANNVLGKSDRAQGKKSLSRDDWNKMFASQDDEEPEDDFDTDDISNKRGDDLYVAADGMCMEQTPQKCKSLQEMLKLLYAQKIKSDCVAFENSIKKQTGELKVKMADAEKSVRNAALKQYGQSNQYGLGQCTRELKKCMQTTAGCGNDFGACVMLSANENVDNAGKKVVIDNGLTRLEISASTVDNLLAKKIVCEDILNKCENVKNDVWDAFLKESAFDLKTAEANTESNLRGNCLANITQCYVKSCREHFDVNDDKGSYDMCLSRPENYKSFCKIELEPCLKATGGSYNEPEKSRLWVGVMAKLSAMRVDACTSEFKSCIQDNDRCGADYSKCIGLDVDDVVAICPTDKLTACYREYGNKKETVEQTLAATAQGVLLNVESSLMTACQNAVDEAMLKVCGDTENCNGLLVDEGTGARSLEIKFCESDGDKYVNCKTSVDEILDKELGKTLRNSDLSKTRNDRHAFSGVITGLIDWEKISWLKDNSGIISGDKYMDSVDFEPYIDNKVKSKIKTEIGALSIIIKNAISTIESDPKVQFCMTGRKVEGLTMQGGFEQVIGNENRATYPNITQSARIAIIDAALLKAQENYTKKYDEIIQTYVESQEKLHNRLAEIEDANFHLDVQDSARRKCIEIGENAAFSGKLGGKSAKKKIERERNSDGNLVGTSSESTYNFKRVVTTTFDMQRMICKKCERTQKCKKAKSNWCKFWGDEQEKCEEIKFEN